MKDIRLNNVKEASGFLDKAFGMLLERNKDGIILRTRFGIHTFFMKSPVDALVLDSDNKVVAIKENLKPNRIYLWNIKYDTVVELPQRRIKGIEIGDKLDF